MLRHTTCFGQRVYCNWFLVQTTDYIHVTKHNDVTTYLNQKLHKSSRFMNLSYFQFVQLSSSTPYIHYGRRLTTVNYVIKTMSAKYTFFYLYLQIKFFIRNTQTRIHLPKPKAINKISRSSSVQCNFSNSETRYLTIYDSNSDRK